MRGIEENRSHRIKWHGRILTIQPRTRVWRYLTDNRTHYHIGYNLLINGASDERKTAFWVAVSEKQQQKYGFQIGDTIAGSGWTKKYPEREFADYYRAGSMKILAPGHDLNLTTAPYTGLLPDLQTYEERGARMLSKSLWQGKCLTCFWQLWPMLKSNGILIVILRNIGLKRIVMVPNPVAIIKWAELGRCRIKTAVQSAMMAISTSFAQRAGIGMIKQ